MIASVQRRCNDSHLQELRHLKDFAKASVLLALVMLGSAAALPAQRNQSIEYEIAFPNAAQHEGHVTVTFRGVPRGTTLEARMARSSPGRYSPTGFAKNVYDVRAFDGAIIQQHRPRMNDEVHVVEPGVQHIGCQPKTHEALQCLRQLPGWVRLLRS